MHSRFGGLRTLAVSGMLVVTALVAGCVQDPDEAGAPDVAEPGIRWQDNLTMPEDADAAWVNLSVERNAPNEGTVRVIVEDPDDRVVAESEDAWPAGAHPMAVEFAFGNVTNASADVPLTPGEWSIKVITDGSVRVLLDVKVLNGNGHREF